MLNLTAPAVKRFYKAAEAHLEAHLEAAEALLEKCPEKARTTRGHDVVYLSGYVVDCALKALLLSRTPKNKHPELLRQLKEEFGHNLEKLKNELSQKGVDFPREQKEHLKRLRQKDTGWSPEMRYDVISWSRENAERVFLAAKSILKWVSGG